MARLYGCYTEYTEYTGGNLGALAGSIWRHDQWILEALAACTTSRRYHVAKSLHRSVGILILCFDFVIGLVSSRALFY